MTDEDTTDNTDDIEPVEEQKAENPEAGQEGDILEQAEAQVEALHDQLDQIKEAGQNIPQELQEALPEDAEQDTVMEYQRIITKANLLYRRVETGDSNVVRGN